MNREKILCKSRAENQNKDIYELEILRQASTYAVIVLLILATIFFTAQILTGGGINYGIYAIAFPAMPRMRGLNICISDKALNLSTRSS